MGWNGLGVGLSNLWRLADGETRSISPENFTGEKGRGGMAVGGHGRRSGPRPRPGLEDLAVGADRAGRRVRARRHRRLRRHPAHLAHADRRLAQPDPADVLGRRPAAGRRVPARRLLRPRLGRVRAHLLARRVRQPGPGVQLLLGDAVHRPGAHHPDQRVRRGPAALLPDRLHALRRARRRGPVLRPVPARQPAAARARSSRSSTASAAAATTSARRARGASTAAAGGARAS